MRYMEVNKLEKELELIESKYKREIKPLWEKREYVQAGIKVENIFSHLLFEEIGLEFTRYSHGVTLLLCLELLGKNLKQNFPSDKYIEAFETELSNSQFVLNSNSQS